MFHCPKTDGFCIPLEDTMAMVFPSGIFEGPKLEGASRVQVGPTDTHVIVERPVEAASDVIPPTLQFLSMPSLSIQLPSLSQIDMAEEDQTARLEIATFERAEEIVLAARRLETLAREEKARLEEETIQAEADVGTIQLAREKVVHDLTSWEDNAYKKFVLLLGEKLIGRSATSTVEEPTAPERVADPFRKRAREDCHTRLAARKKAKSPTSEEVSHCAASSSRAQEGIMASDVLPSLVMGSTPASMKRARAVKEDPTIGRGDAPASSSTLGVSTNYRCKKEEEGANSGKKVVSAESVIDEMFSDTAFASQANWASEGAERSGPSGVHRAIPETQEGLGTCSSLGSIVFPDDLEDGPPAGEASRISCSPEFD